MGAVICSATANSYAQKITISEKNSPLMKVLNKVSKQSDYDFIITNETSTKAHPVTVDLKDVNLQEALNAIFFSQPLRYDIRDKSIIVSQKATAIDLTNNSSVAFIDIKGKVVNKNGTPLIGASVNIKGTKKTTLTDENGDFKLQDIDPIAVVTVSYIGHETKELKIAPDLGTIVLSLTEQALQQVEVTINTGYQRISKERSAGAYSKPDMNILHDRSTSMNVLTRLDGLVPGLVVNNSPSGDPLSVRGLSTINANRSPLIVVDGIVISDISLLNPNDVSDITVLKDATAASIWGARATNGVIVISTKKGGKDQKPQINYNAFINLKGKPEFDYFPTLNSAEYIKASQEIFDYVNWPYSTASNHLTNTKRVGIAPDKQILYDMARGALDITKGQHMLDSLASIDNHDQIRDIWYTPAYTTNHNLSISGGKNWHSFYTSLAYTKDQSYQPGTKGDTYKINVRQDFNFGKILSAYLINDVTNGINKSNRPISISSKFLPYQLFRDSDGNSISMPYMGSVSEETRKFAEERSKISLDYDPIADQFTGDSKSNSLNTRSVLGLTLNLPANLRFEGVYGYNTGNSKHQSYNDNSKYTQRYELVNFTYAPTPESTPVYYLPLKGGKYGVQSGLQRSWTVRNQLIWDQDWNNGDHQLTALVGNEVQDQLSQNNSSLAYGFNRRLLTSPSLDYATLTSPGYKNTVLPNGSSNASSLNVNAEKLFGESESNYRFLSYYGNLGYTFLNRYSLNASIRNDQSNLFGKSKSAQGKSVWSIGGKWTISREQFFNSLTDNIGELALRVTHGLTGNSPIPGSSASEDILSPVTNPRLPNGTGLYISIPGNPSLTWETTKTTNIGIDFSVVKNRISGSLDYYNKQTSNLLGDMQINPLTGFNTIIGNLGDISNKGIELALSSRNISKENWSWSSQLALSYNKNKVKSIQLNKTITMGQDKVAQAYLPGYAAYALFAYNFAGLDNLGDPLVTRADNSTTKINQDVSADDVLFMGTTQQPWNGGLFNNFQYKNFNLNIGLIFNMGHVLLRDVNTLYYSESGNSYINSGDFQSGNFHKEFAERWQKPGDEAYTNVPSFVSASATSVSRRDVNHYELGNINVLDASYIKIRDIMLRYDLPESLFKNVKNIQKISINAQISNLMLWKANNAGIDPEFHYTRSGWSGSRITRSNQGTFTFGLNVAF